MSPLNIEAAKSTPSVRFDPDAGVLDISGESYPENAAAFYDPILRDIGQWLASAESLTANFELRYYNSSSSKVLMNLMDMFESAARKGTIIRVVWRFHEENEIIQESGEEFQEDYEHLDFELVTISAEE